VGCSPARFYQTCIQTRVRAAAVPVGIDAVGIDAVGIDPSSE
jgi:hypothetical protein